MLAHRCPLHHSKSLLTKINLRTLTPQRQRTPGFFSLSTSSNPCRARHTNLQSRRQWCRNFSTSEPKRDEPDETGTGKRKLPVALLYKPRSLSEEEAWAVIDRAKEVWPSNQPPHTWSSDWAEWDNLFPLYWHSPHYFMIPNIELFVNLQYGIQGETRPLFYSLPVSQEDWLNVKKRIGDMGRYLSTTPPDHLFFTIVGKEDSTVYMAEMGAHSITRLFSGEKPVGADGLLDALADPHDNLIYEPLYPSKEGCQLLDRIFARDPTVAEVLGEEKWLGTVPKPTETWQEWAALPEALSGDDVENDRTEKFDGEAVENKNTSKVDDEEPVEEDDEADEAEEPEEIQLSSEEQAALEDARQLGLTKDMDELSEIMQEAESHVHRAVKRLGEILAEAADPSSSSPSTPPAEDEGSLAADPLSTDPDAVDRAVEHVLNADSDALSLSYLRGLSVEQLAQVKDRLEAIAASLAEKGPGAASEWKSEGDGDMETSRVDDDRVRVRVPLKPSEGGGSNHGGS